ncbi:MAG: leucyl/phenylalanyl-tRNA--protein transferase [Cyanobacteriota/Melainabacteria group bacterium]|nr:leucyl/phenylalanyl-tRNA--protein transferase [Cyanobacteria bacterium HKST-UBA01]MCB9470829.1 leucyl/phenylalanyl-tRNA--protein transferase [Candidatus Obscuribacterales bacterium]
MKEPFTKDLVLSAYSQGIFPMGHDDGTIRWYSPDPRCIFDFDKFHVPRRLMRTYKSGKFEMKVNSAWREVLKACADRDSTWITDDIFRVYTEMHEAGFAHSVEAYYEGKLAGGLYGVSIGGAFMGESMFHNVTDASKISLIYLVERLKSRGFVLLDSQYMTDHLSTLGAVLIPRQEYLRRLDRALYLDCRFA